MRTIVCLLLLLLLVFPGKGLLAHSLKTSPEQAMQAKSPEPAAHWVYGLSLGGYWASQATANYYNGSGEHNLEEALFRFYNYNRVATALGVDSFFLHQLPQDMRYRPAMQVGLFGGLAFPGGLTIMGAFNYTRLQVADRFTVALKKYSPTSEPVLVLGDIRGIEERIDIRLGLQYTFVRDTYIHPFLEAGMSITDIKVIENRAALAGVSLNIRNLQNELYQERDYGIGFGAFGGAGIRFEVTESLYFQWAATVNITQVNLGEYTQMQPQFSTFLRLFFHTF